MESQFFQINILNILFKWWKHIAVIVSVSAVFAVIFSSSLFITPKFKSFGIMYPSNIKPYSDESESEQMLQILQSIDIRDSVVKKYNLTRHWKIDSSYKYFASTLAWEFSQSVKISKTPYDGVIIEAWDRDPHMACDIVNGLIEFYNKKVRSLHEDKFLEVVKLYERGLAKKREYLDSLVLRLQELGLKYGLFEYEAQAQEISRGFLRTIDGSGADRINTKEVLKLKENIENKGGELIAVTKLIENEAVNYAEIRKQYDRSYMDWDRKFSYTNLITKPYPSDKKSYPVRWLIVTMSILTSFLLSFITILIIENFKLAKYSSRN
jgi:capsule polysaccharide export protein KpsE/RkpR